MSRVSETVSFWLEGRRREAANPGEFESRSNVFKNDIETNAESLIAVAAERFWNKAPFLR